MNGPPPVRIPTLDELVRDPDQAAELPLETLLELRCQLHHLDADLERHVAAKQLAEPRRDGRPDRRLDIEEAAAKLKISEDWLYRNADELPFTVRLGDTLGFSERGIEEFLRKPGAGARPGRRRRP